MDTLVFEVWDWDRMADNEYLGEVKFSIVSILSTLPKCW